MLFRTVAGRRHARADPEPRGRDEGGASDASITPLTHSPTAPSDLAAPLPRADQHSEA